MHHLVVTDNPDFESDKIIVKTFNDLDSVTDRSCYRVEVPRFDEVKYDQFSEISRKLTEKVREDGYLYIRGHTLQSLYSSVLHPSDIAKIIEKANFLYSPLYIRELLTNYGLELDYHKHKPQQPFIYEMRLWR